MYMKVRASFVTNSSSTNFLIISKEELTKDYLMKKMGFKINSPILNIADELSRDVMFGASKDFVCFDIDGNDPEVLINYENIKNIFGEVSAKRFVDMKKKGYISYVGTTSTNDGEITAFMTLDNFVIDEKDFYMNGICSDII